MSELQTKDIINVSDGKKIGNIIDVVINDGKILSLVIEQNKMFMSKFMGNNEIEVGWSNIEKIGEDVILVKLN